MGEERRVKANLVGDNYYWGGDLLPEIDLFRDRGADEVLELRENGDVFIHIKYFKQNCTLLMDDINCSTGFESQPVLLKKGVRDFGVYDRTVYFQMRDGARKVFEITDAWAQNALVKAGVAWINTDSMEEATSL